MSLERFYKYGPPISAYQRHLYEQALENEKRWQEGWMTSDIEETDLDHTKGLFEIHGEMEYKAPNLFREVDFPETEHMFYVHDGGELGGLDLPHSAPDYDRRRPKIKRRERATFRMITRDYIDDPEVRKYARDIYRRYEEKDPSDKVAQYVQLIDKVQATRFGAVNVFPARKLRTKAERLQQLNHVYALLAQPAEKLFALVSSSSQEELYTFLDGELELFIANGYRRSEVDPYRKKMAQLLRSGLEFNPNGVVDTDISKEVFGTSETGVAQELPVPRLETAS